MIWASGSDSVLLLRRLRNRLYDEFSDVHVDITDIEALLQTARDIVLAVRTELIAARGTHPKVDDRLTAIESRLDILETPPPPEEP